MKLSIPCPQCGNKAFKFDAEPESLDNLQSPICLSCGHKLTQDQVEAHIRHVGETQALGVLKAAFGKLLK